MKQMNCVNRIWPTMLLVAACWTSQAAQSSTARQIHSLDGTWKVSRLPLESEGEPGLATFKKGDAKTIDATVPGEIHLDLMKSGEMQDPSVGTNSRKDRWPERFSWWYRTSFTPPDGFTNQDKQELVFQSLSYYAQVFLNGVLVATNKNSLVPCRINVTSLLKPGENELIIRLTSGFEFVNEVDQDFSKLGLYKNRENLPARENLRSPAYMTGWDWCDTLPNIGIRSVTLEGRSRAELSYVRMHTVTFPDGKIALEGVATIENLKAWKRTPCTLKLDLARPNGDPISVKYDYFLPMGTSRFPLRINIPNPQLWWPNGMGEQPLYKLRASLASDGTETDSVIHTLGLRTVVLDQSPLKVGANFRFIVNGKEMFAKGGNWAPADEIPARMTPERYGHFIAAAKEAHFNFMRVNGVGYYEDDTFYDACDKAGILLWQEFAYSCSKYNDQSAEFMRGARIEAEEAVKWIANHPSLAVWCGCNECLWMYAGEKNPVPSEPIGIKVYYDLLPDVLHNFDPTTPYIPGSPCGGADELNSQTSGDVHWWYQVFMSGDPKVKMNPAILDTCTGRFVSEYGIIGPPPIASMKEYLAPDELNPDSMAWRIHTNSYEGDHRGFTESAAAHHFLGDGPMTVDNFVLYGGLYQAMMQEGMMEASRFRKNDPENPCAGNLMWSYNDCWGEIGWSIIDHYGRLKPSYYAVKRAAAPVKVIVRSRGDELVTRVVNDTLHSEEVEVTYGWVKVDGSAREVQTKHVKVEANGMVELAREKLKDPDGNPKAWVYAATMKGPNGEDDHSIWRETTYRDLSLPTPTIKVERKGDDLLVSSDYYAVGVHIPEGDGRLSDGYFDLLPGVPHVVHVIKSPSNGKFEFKASLPVAH